MSYGVRQSVPNSAGQTAIALLVGVDCTAGVGFCVGVGVTPVLVLPFPKGAQEESSSNIARSANIRRGVCICVSYLSCIVVCIENHRQVLHAILTSDTPRMNIIRLMI